MSTVRANNYYDASGGSAAQLYGVSMRYGGTAWVNRIINGDMRIDQRNAGAAVTTAGAYPVDRWAVAFSNDGAFSAQRSTTAATGFSNSLSFTTTTADASLSASQYACILQRIEGFNTADLGWGAAGAQSVTLSFWTRSSLTGTFGGSIRNGASNRSYPFTYTINAANTWEQKTITVAGDTTGTWGVSNDVGIDVIFGLGVGSSLSGTAGAWASSNLLSATGTVSVIGTLNATFYITGVQLEAGTVASPFERRDYGRELMMCQRYYEKSFNVDTAPAQNAGTTGAFYFAQSAGASASQMGAPVRFKVEKRASPTTLTLYNPSATNAQIRNDVTNSDWSGSATGNGGTSGFRVYGTSPAGSSAGQSGLFHWSGEAEL